MYTEYLLSLYIVLFLSSIVFLAFRVKRQTGVFPIVKHAGGVYGFVDRVVLLAYTLMIINTLSFVADYQPLAIMVPLALPATDIIRVFGSVLIGTALSFLFLAQLQMGKSWRIGIDNHHDIAPVQHGLFKYFRHPIYFFALIIGIGMILVIPTVSSIVIGLLLYLALSIQARLEEEFMLTKFPDFYREFIKTRHRFF